MLVRLSELDTYIYCPRKVYFETIYRGEHFSETNLMKEIYYQWRLGENDPVSSAIEKTGLIEDKQFKGHIDYFHIIKMLERCEELKNLRQVDYDLLLTSEKLGLTGIVDEIVKRDEIFGCLILRKNPPENGIWRADRIKLAALKIMLEENGYGISECYVYYWNKGVLRKAETGFHDRRQVVRIVERIKKIKNGFLPDRISEERCRGCNYKESCEIEGVSFKARFF